MDKKKTGMITCLFLFVMLLGACDSGILDDSPPPLEYADTEQTEFLLFRCGDNYLTHKNGDKEWLEIYGDVPDSLSLSDGEFAYVDAEIARVYGSGSFYNGNPEIRKVNNFSKIIPGDLIENKELEEYDPDSSFYGLRYCMSGSDIYCLVYYRGTYYAYGNNGYIGSFNTSYEAEIAMGMRDPVDEAYTFGELKDVDVYVIRCDDDYLVYYNNAAFVENLWRLMLNEDFENELTGRVLNDGEMVRVSDVNLFRVNGGEYSNALMLSSVPNISDYGYDDFFKHTYVSKWEEKGSNSEEGEFRNLHEGKYLVILHNGQYHVYQDQGTEQFLIGVYDSASEIEKL